MNVVSNRGSHQDRNPDGSMHEYTVPGLHEFMEREVKDLPRDTPILDIGCGSGAWLARLQRMGFTDLTGMDLEPPSIDVQVIQANIDRDEPELFFRQFKLVTSFEVAEHLENIGAYLRTICRALAPDGFAIISTPNIHSLRARLKFMLAGKLPSFDEKGEETHITPISLPRLGELAGQSGLRVVRAWSYPERGTKSFGRPIRALAAISRPFLPDPLPGDSLCVLMERIRSD